jgi:hypothetical protein
VVSDAQFIWLINHHFSLKTNSNQQRYFSLISEHFSGRAEKNSVISGKKNLPMTNPLGTSGLNFRAKPGLGRAARIFYSVKQLKTAFRTRLGPKKIFTDFKISTHARRSELKMLRYIFSQNKLAPTKRTTVVM